MAQAIGRASAAYADGKAAQKKHVRIILGVQLG